MRGQLLIENILYVILYIFLIFSIYYIAFDYYKNLEKNANLYEHIKKFYTLEKKLDLLYNSEYSVINLSYPMESDMRHISSMIIKENGSIIIFTTYD